MGLASFTLGVYFILKDNIVRLVRNYLHIAETSAEDVGALVDDHTHNFIATICIILIATGLGVIFISLIGFCGAVKRNTHCICGVS